MNNEALIRSFYESVASRNLDQVLSFFSDDAQFRNIGSEEVFRGKGEIRGMVDRWMKAFPDGKFQIQRLIGNGDLCAVEFSFVGTHQGTLSGKMGDIPATGKKVNVPSVDVLTLKNEKIQSLNCYFSGTVLLNQIGAMPGVKAA
jgi:steroid delta-isomerase-like uncharacterized protein